jgi:hypothetical protein
MRLFITGFMRRLKDGFVVILSAVRDLNYDAGVREKLYSPCGFSVTII